MKCFDDSADLPVPLTICLRGRLSAAPRLAIKKPDFTYVGQSLQNDQNISRCNRPFQAGDEVYHRIKTCGEIGKQENSHRISPILQISVRILPMNQVTQFYDQNVSSEWTRLSERHRTEFAVTLRALAEYVPPPPARLLDLGGGPGRYALELARQGYTVTLADISSAELDFARQQAQAQGIILAEVMTLDARHLSPLSNASFDIVLMLGPLYHLLSLPDRQAALNEACRVLRPGGLMLAGFISRFAPFRDAAVKYPDWLEKEPEYAESILQTGVHDQPQGWTAYFAHPNEIKPFMESAGLHSLALIGTEGVAAGHETALNNLDGELWERWVALNYRLGQDPALLGAADHLLYVGRK